MNDMKQAVLNAMDKIIESGSIEKKIEETIQKTIETIINDFFKDYSDFSRDLKKQVSEKIKVDLDIIELPAYNTMIENAIKTRVNDVIKKEHQDLINKNLDSILKVEEKDWKLSEFIEEFKESLFDYEKHGESISLHVEGSSCSDESFHIFVDSSEGKKDYECEIRIFTSKNKILSVDWRGEKWDKDIFLGWKHDIEATLFRIYSQGKQFIVDEDDVNIHFPDYD